jgi:transcriptional regulator with XRE-family HTH domain
MDNRSEARDFLASRRARITPQQAGLPLFGTNRRVPGLRRDEVAVLAGISVEYYTRLERGNLGGASEGVLDAVAGALHLDDTERAHLFDLSRTANMPANKPRRPTAQRVRPGVQRVLDAMVAAPAWVRNGRSDFLAGNRLGRALYAPIFKDPVRPTPPGSPSSIRTRKSSMPTGIGSPTTWWESCAQRPAATHTTGASPT